MKKHIFFVFILLIASKSFSQNGWCLAKDKDGIKVFVNEVTGSYYYEFKAVMTVKSSTNEILEILKDVKNYPNWFAYTTSAKLLNESTYEQTFLMETNYTWPFSNECMVYKMNFPKNISNYYKISINETKIDSKCKYSLKKATGYILIESEKENTTITYYCHVEPFQKIPPWLINPRIHEMPFRTFIAFRKKLKEN